MNVWWAFRATIHLPYKPSSFLYTQHNILKCHVTKYQLLCSNFAGSNLATLSGSCSCTNVNVWNLFWGLWVTGNDNDICIWLTGDYYLSPVTLHTCGFDWTPWVRPWANNCVHEAILLIVTATEAGSCLSVTTVSFHVLLDCAVISPHLVSSRWAAACSHRSGPPAFKNRSMAPLHLRCSPAMMMMKMMMTTIIILLLSLAHKHALTAGGIDKCHPLVLSSSSSKNITPPLRLFYQSFQNVTSSSFPSSSLLFVQCSSSSCFSLHTFLLISSFPSFVLLLFLIWYCFILCWTTNKHKACLILPLPHSIASNKYVKRFKFH